MASRKYTLSHLTYATEWDHVNAAFIASTEVDGETFEKPTERLLNSKPVMDAVAVLQKAVLKELGADSKGAEIRTMRSVRDAALKAAEKSGIPVTLGLMPSDVAPMVEKKKKVSRSVKR